MASNLQHNEGDSPNEELSTVSSTAGLIKSLSGRVTEKYASGILTFVIAAGLPLVEEFFVEAQYRCPCLTEEECNKGRTTGSYAIIPVFFSTSVIFFLGFLGNATIQCVRKDGRRKHGLTCGDFWFWTVQALVICLTWLCILAIDGDYFACATECNAYNATCEMVDLIADRAELPFTDAYRDAKETSQWAGYIAALVPLGLFMLVNFTKFDQTCCQKSCCCCCCRCCRCCCEFDEELSPSEEKKLDKDMEKAALNLKRIVISRTGDILEKYNIPGIPQAIVQETQQ